MKKNVGGGDKTFRIILGLVILILGIIYESWWGLIGLIPLGTALIGWCPLYLPFGISTCKTKEAEAKQE
ncbi:YgaP family membrane protein [Melioribacter sp. Ez-97]|uniref:YgaP family membrane protein n=1 Tax=Melioribacter sp. Ez-97 TaxID=3423434 RepID=UPI003ED9FE77